jgi:hypothetical protein
MGVSHLPFVISAGLLIFDSYAEENVGIIAACIPCLKSLMERFLRVFGGHISNTITKAHSPFGTIGGMTVSIQGGSQTHPMRSPRGSKRFSGFKNKGRGLESGENSIFTNSNGLAEERDLEAAAIVREVEISWSEDRGNS